MNIGIGFELVTERMTLLDWIGISVSICMLVLLIGAIIFDKMDEKHK